MESKQVEWVRSISVVDVDRFQVAVSPRSFSGRDWQN